MRVAAIADWHVDYRIQRQGKKPDEYMAKIITVTANTSIDFIIEADGLAVRDNILAKNSTEFACGKGINVAKAAESLGYPVVCLGFAGRQSINLFNELNSGLLQTDLIGVDGKTRTNITLLDSAENRETHIRTAGFAVTLDDCRKLMDKIESYAAAGDIVIFSGSLPPGAPDDLYQTLIDRCHGKSVIPFLDAGGKGLVEGLKARPYLIKPNQQELEELIGGTLPNERAIADAARSLIDQGTKWVYVSLGSQGAVAVGENIALTACVKGQFGKIATRIGCGDAMVAGLAAALLQKLGLEETIKLGVACGAVNLFSIEPGRLARDRLLELIDHVNVFPL